MTNPTSNPSSSYVLCVSNAGHPASLEVRKIYRGLPDPAAAGRGLIRVIDESGEDYLYPSDMFVPIKLPRPILKALATDEPPNKALRPTAPPSIPGTSSRTAAVAPIRRSVRGRHG